MTPPPARVSIVVDGRAISVPEGATVAAVLVGNGVARFRRSVSGEPRGPLCAMGICFECRVKIDGAPHRRACMVEVAPGMRIETDE